MTEVKKQKIIQGVTIDKIGHGGIGIARQADGRKILITGGVLPGMKVDVLVTKGRKDYVEGKVYHIHSYDPTFSPVEKVICPHYFFHADDGLDHQGLGEEKVGCGGCKRQILSYDKQLLLKSQIITDSFRHIKDVIAAVGIMPFVPAPEVFGYRNKIEYSFGKYISWMSNVQSPKEDGEDDEWETNPQSPISNLSSRIPHHLSDWQLGFHKQGQFSKVIDIDQCYLVSVEARKLYQTLKKLLLDSWLPVYDQKTHEGFLRHLVIREGRHTGHFLVNLSVAEKQIQTLGIHDQREKFKTDLENHDELKKTITTFVITFNDGLADIVKGHDFAPTLLWGEGQIYEKLCFSGENGGTMEEDWGKLWLAAPIEVNFRISPFSFFQTNTLGAERLFHTAMDAVGQVEWTILDLYCGTGSIGLSFLKAGKGNALMGIEIVSEAIVDAVRNAKINGLSDVSYFAAGKAEDLVFHDAFVAEHMKEVKLVIVDPPRDGLHKDVVKFLIDLKTKYEFKFVYISCNPVTMARDLELLLAGGYTLRHLQPVDMFPHTHHVEMVGVLA